MKTRLNRVLLGLLCAVLLAAPALSHAKEKKCRKASASCSDRKKQCHHKVAQGYWQPLTNPGAFGPDTQFPTIGNPLLMTDGSVMVLNQSFPNLGEVWKLTPDEFGSYVNGTWSQLASLPDGYAPYAFGSAVLPDGRVILEGGEANGPLFALEWTDMGAIYNPLKDEWKPVTPPAFFGGNIGDAQTAVLPDGTFMLANSVTKQAALLDACSLTWTETGTSTKWDVNDEEGWVLLPNGKVLCVDASGVNAPLTVITTDPAIVGPFVAFPATGPFANNVAPTAPISGPGAIASPDDTACTPITTDLTGKIGICYRSTHCASGTIVPNMAAAHALAVIEISNKVAANASGGANGVPFSCMISEADGAVLAAAVEANPTMVITLVQNPATVIQTNSEIYDPATGTWSRAGSIIVPISDPIFQEQGPGVLRPDGTVFWGGSAYGNTAIYDTNTNTWSIGPKFPYVIGEGQLGQCDAPSALLPNGNVLVAASQVTGGEGAVPPLHIYECNGSEFFEQPSVPDGQLTGTSSFSMLVLPTGQIMMVSGLSTDVEIYTSGNTKYNPCWAPVVTCSPEKVSKGKTYKIEGIRFNGMSQGAMFGDDIQAATNYPLVRITNCKTGHVFYCRTHDHSYMGVASDKEVFTYFDVPSNIECGEGKLEVVANGIPSLPVDIVVQHHKHHSH